MVVPAFPIFKLASLVIKQFNKPLKNIIIKAAKKSHVIRTYIVIPPAQLYNRIQVNYKMRDLNLGKPTEVQKLSENMAIELGAGLIGNSVVWAALIGFIVYEYRSSKSTQAEKDKAFEDLKDDVVNLNYRVSEMEAEVKHLTRIAHSKHKSGKTLEKKESTSTTQETKDSDKTLIDKAVTDGIKILKGVD